MFTHKKCSIEGCEKLVAARKLCPMHYARWSRHGDPNITLRGDGSIDTDGYHRTSENGTAAPTHRLIMETHLGRKLTPNEVVHHKNGNKLDNRLANLQVMTRREHLLHHGITHLNPVTLTKTKRWCGACKTVKHIGEFQKCSRNLSGVQSQCRSCRKRICHETYIKKLAKSIGI
jgi:HNH endonuclease